MITRKEQVLVSLNGVVKYIQQRLNNKKLTKAELLTDLKNIMAVVEKNVDEIKKLK